MGVDPLTIGVIVGAVAAVGGAASGIVAGNQQRAAARHSADLQRQAQEDQNANQAAQAAQERRQQVRDERIRRARVEQSSVNTGVEGSSGELGALASISTQSQANYGFNLGALSRAQDISTLNQEAADTIFQGNQRAGETGIATSIFGGISQGANNFERAAAKTKSTGATDAYGNSLE